MRVMGTIIDQSMSPRNSSGGGTGGFELWLRGVTEAKGSRLCFSQTPKDELGILGEEVGRVFQGERQVSSRHRNRCSGQRSADHQDPCGPTHVKESLLKGRGSS